MTEMRSKTPAQRNRKAIIDDATGIWEQLKTMAKNATPKLREAAVAGRAAIEAREEALGLSPGKRARDAKQKDEEEEIKRIARLRGKTPEAVKKEIDDQALAAKKKLGLTDAQLKELQDKKEKEEAIDRVAKRWNLNPADIETMRKGPNRRVSQIGDVASFHNQLQSALSVNPAAKAQIKMQQQLAPVPDLLKTANAILANVAKALAKLKARATH
jgi:hypothetical protein